MRREEARRNKYCLTKSNQVYVEETEDKKSSDKKASEVIEVVFEMCDVCFCRINCRLKVF